jgi:hypothetical protein
MPKYEAVIDLTVEIDASDSDSADKLILGELTNRLLEVASKDNTFKLWLEVREIDEVL